MKHSQNLWQELECGALSMGTLDRGSNSDLWKATAAHGPIGTHVCIGWSVCIMLESSWPNACSSENHPQAKNWWASPSWAGAMWLYSTLSQQTFFFLLSLISSSFTKRQERESNDCLWVLAASLLKGSWSFKLALLLLYRWKGDWGCRRVCFKSSHRRSSVCFGVSVN